MCVICCSPKGTPQPTIPTIRRMFARNPHGAGYMYARDGKVTIHKGFMNIEDLLRQLKVEHFTADDPVVYHFRISTQAGVTPTMTQPFPLTSSLDKCEKLDILACGCGIAHNGIIRMTSDGDPQYSDTALFITQYATRILHNVSDLKDPNILDILSELTHSRLALLDRTGYIATVGNYITECNGLMYSNTCYQPPVTPPHVKKTYCDYYPYRI